MPDPNDTPAAGSLPRAVPGHQGNQRTFEANGTESGKWTYTSRLTVPVGFPLVKPVEKTTEVVDPLNHKTIHYFGAYPGDGVPEVDPPGGYGLPFSVRENDGAGRFVSQRTFRSGDYVNPLKTEWVRYYEGFDDEARPRSRKKPCGKASGKPRTGAISTASATTAPW